MGMVSCRHLVHNDTMIACHPQRFFGMSNLSASGFCSQLDTLRRASLSPLSGQPINHAFMIIYGYIQGAKAIVEEV